MNEHPTESELTGYVKGTLIPGDLLRVDDHLAACPPCRRAAVEAAGVGKRLASTVAALHHDLGSAVDARPAGRVLTFRAAATSHIRRRGLAYAAAAVVMIITDVILAVRTRPAPHPSQAPTARAAQPVGEVASSAPETLTPDERALVNISIAAGHMPASRALAAVASASGALMGAAPVALATLGPRSPVGVVVDSDRPTLEWGASDPHATYRVQVFNESFEPMAVSAWQSESRWTIDRALARGQVYTWQVTARLNGRDTTAPAPPQPEAKFMVTTADDSARIGALRKRAGDSHLALAVLLAQEGLLDEAEHELALSPPSNTVMQLRQSLAQLRRSQ